MSRIDEIKHRIGDTDREYTDHTYFREVPLNGANDEEQRAYRTIARGDGNPAAPILAGYKKKSGKTVIVNSDMEGRRRSAMLHGRLAIALLCILVFLVALGSAVEVFSHSHEYDRLKFYFSQGENTEDRELFRFGPFEGYVTVGDSLERVNDILGAPEEICEPLYYYGNSYLIVEEGVVVGYYRDPAEELPVTVGFLWEGMAGRVMEGDSADSVVQRLGSPDYFFGRSWLYDGCNGVAGSHYTQKGRFEVLFDDKGAVCGCNYLE